jgi:hypothetical protein
MWLDRQFSYKSKGSTVRPRLNSTCVSIFDRRANQYRSIDRSIQISSLFVKFQPLASYPFTTNSNPPRCSGGGLVLVRISVDRYSIYSVWGFYYRGGRGAG